MFAIVIHHYAYHGTFDWTVYNPNVAGALKINIFLHFFGKLGVVIFVMIGAYFLCEKRFNFYRPINLILTMAFYSFGIYIVLKIFFPSKIWGPDTLTRMLLPFPLPSGYWFVYAYLVMLFAMPCLNIIISNLNKQKLLLLIIGLVMLWSLLPIGMKVFNNKPDTTIDNFGYTPATYFFVIYFVSAYIRKYSGRILNSRKYTGLISLGLLLATVLLTSLMNSQRFMDGLLDLYDVNSPIALLAAIFIFSYFKNVHFKSKIINYIAGSMFGVYLIHEDSFIRPIIWQQIISSKAIAHSTLLYLGQAVGYSLLVFGSCVILDIIIRRLFFEKEIKKLSLKISVWLGNKTSRIIKD
jgi:surface polysaccharide O-acyltransferase-like enzyme